MVASLVVQMVASKDASKVGLMADSKVDWRARLRAVSWVVE